MSPDRMLHTALGLELLGVLVESISIVKTTPITFMLFVAVAIPLMAAGLLLYLVYLFRRLWMSEQATTPAPPGR